MRALHTWWLGVAAAGSVLAGALYVGCTTLARPTWSAGPNEVERLERLTTDFGAMARRQEFLRCLAADVVEGRLSLRDAGEAVRREDVSSPPHLRMHIENLPGGTEEERYCRSVLGHVRALLDGDPRGPATLARLEGEVEDVVQGRAAPARWTAVGGRLLPPRPPEGLTLGPAAEQAARGQAQ